MDQVLENTIARFARLHVFFLKYAAAMADIPKLLARVAEFETFRAKLPVVAADNAAAAPTTGAVHGATLAKQADRSKVIALLVSAMSALNQHFEEVAETTTDAALKNDAIKQAADMDLQRPGDLPNMGTAAFVTLYTKALNLWTALPKDALAGYGQHEKPEREAFKTATASFDGTQTLPTDAIDDRHNAGLLVQQQVDALALFVKKPLIKAVNLLHAKNPEFVEAFHLANRTDHRRGGHAGPSAPVVPPVTP